jgi:mannose-1-phosphate guanylyltransferase
MKAFILAAGSGTRLRPLTDITPKCLLPIAGVPLLEIWLKTCRAAGISDVIVNANAHAAQIIEFARRPDLPVRVQVAEEPVLLGSAGTLAQNRGFITTE